jgi:hypothetical protein
VLLLPGVALAGGSPPQAVLCKLQQPRRLWSGWWCGNGPGPKYPQPLRPRTTGLVRGVLEVVDLVVAGAASVSPWVAVGQLINEAGGLQVGNTR